MESNQQESIRRIYASKLQFETLFLQFEHSPFFTTDPVLSVTIGDNRSPKTKTSNVSVKLFSKYNSYRTLPPTTCGE